MTPFTSVYICVHLFTLCVLINICFLTRSASFLSRSDPRLYQGINWPVIANKFINRFTSFVPSTSTKTTWATFKRLWLFQKNPSCYSSSKFQCLFPTSVITFLDFNNWVKRGLYFISPFRYFTIQWKIVVSIKFIKSGVPRIRTLGLWDEMRRRIHWATYGHLLNFL